MNQKFLTVEEQTKDKETYPELFNQRWLHYNGFLYQYRPEMMFDYTPEQRRELFDQLWSMVWCPVLLCLFSKLTFVLGRFPIPYEQLL